MTQKETFIKKWSNFWILAPKREILDNAFVNELNQIINEDTPDFLIQQNEWYKDKAKALEERVNELEHENFRLSEKNKAQAESLKWLRKVHRPLEIKVKDFELPIDSVMHKGRRV